MLKSWIGPLVLIRIALGVVVVVGLTLGGAVLVLIWFSTMTPIHVIEESELAGSPPTAQEWVDRGAVLFAVGEVEAVYGAEWSTEDRSRPGTPWDVSSVPEDIWIHTPILIGLDDEPVELRPQTVDALSAEMRDDRLLLALRGGELDDDRYEIIDGQDRSFEQGDQVALVLGVQGGDLSEPELIGTTFGAGWEFLARYRIDDDTAVLQWGDDTYEQPIDELVESFQAVID